MTTSRLRGLGRGLNALIPMSREGEAMVPQMIAVDQIRPSHQQVRSRFDAEPLGELAESIRQHGVLQPLLVLRTIDGYELIAGERRWRAARLAGLQSVPAVVRHDTGDDAQLVLGLIENLQRTDLDPIEEARGLKRLTEEFGLTHDEVAQRIGKHRVSVTQSLRLLGGCAAVQSSVAAGAISAGHARALISLESQAAQEHGLKVVIGKRLSVRQTENWVRTYKPQTVSRSSTPKLMAAPQLPAIAANPSRPSTGSSLLRELAEVIVLAIILYFGISFAVQTVHVEGLSMFATLDNNDYLIADKIDYRLHAPQRGDIIILRPPTDNSKDFIKRIIAVPGERLLIRDSIVYINGHRLVEPYLPEAWTANTSWDQCGNPDGCVMASDQYFVMGDNRNRSQDSRIFGPIGRDRIDGRAWFRIWPIEHFGNIYAQMPMLQSGSAAVG